MTRTGRTDEPTDEPPDAAAYTAAILVHLGLLTPGSGFLPTDKARRAQAVYSLCFAATGRPLPHEN